MDRKTLKLPFTLKSSRDWFCPTCQIGILRIKKEAFHREEIRHSRDHSHDAWDPDWISYVFSCMLFCTNPSCKEIVSCTGVGSVNEDFYVDEDGDAQQVYDEFFTPRYFEPHLRLIRIPEKCPESVASLLSESFKLFFCAPSAASNNVRMALEELLTQLKVRRFNSGNKKRTSIRRSYRP